MNLIEEYRETLKMVERAKREAQQNINTAVVVSGKCVETRHAPRGEIFKCSECNKNTVTLHIYQLEQRNVQMCTTCRDSIFEWEADNLLNKAEAEHDVSILSGVASDLRYSLQYMETGFAPGCRRGAHRLSSEQREIPTDPYRFQINAYLVKRAAAGIIQTKALDSEQQEILNNLLSILTEKQKNIFELVHGSGFSLQQTAKMLNLSKSTVQKSIAGAEKKVFFAVGMPRGYIRKPSNSEGDFLKKPHNEGMIQKVMFL